MSLANQIAEYLGATSESSKIFVSEAEQSRLSERLEEMKKLRLELASHGGSIVLPLLEASEPIIKQRANVVRTPLARLSPTMAETMGTRYIKALVDSITELVGQVGRPAESTLILTIEHDSPYVRLLAAALLGMESVRSKASVRPLMGLLDKGNESGIVEVVAVASLLMNRDTDRGARKELSQFLAYWVDNSAQAFEAAGEKSPERSPDGFPTWVHGLIPRILFTLAISEMKN